MSEVTAASLEPHLQRQVESARAAFERGDDERVAVLARAVLAEVPACLPVRKLLRAARLRHTGGRSGLFARILGGITAAPFLLRGVIALDKEPLRAVESAQRILDADPRSVSGLRLLGSAAMQLGWHGTAVYACEAWREIEPDDVGCLLALGRAHLAAGRAGDAMRSAEEALRREPMNGPAQALLKDASVAQSLQQGRWEEGGDYRAKLKTSP